MHNSHKEIDWQSLYQDLLQKYTELTRIHCEQSLKLSDQTTGAIREKDAAFERFKKSFAQTWQSPEEWNPVLSLDLVDQDLNPSISN